LPYLYVWRNHLGDELSRLLLELLLHKVSGLLTASKELVSRCFDSAETEDVVSFDLRECGASLGEDLLEESIDLLDVHVRVGLFSYTQDFLTEL
jgi:hypothetical protein